MQWYNLRMTVSNADSDDTSEEIEIATSSVIKQPLHVTLGGLNGLLLLTRAESQWVNYIITLL